MKAILAALLFAAAIGQADPDEIEQLKDAQRDAMQRQRWDAAIAAGRRLAELAPQDSGPPYNLACAYARKGDRDEAVRWLRMAAERGFSYNATLARDADLDIVRDHPDFGAVRDIIRHNNAKALEAFKPQAEAAVVVEIAPPGLDATKPAPLVVTLHPFGGTAKGIADNWKQSAAEIGAIIIAPQSPKRYGGGYTWGVVEQDVYLVMHAIEKAKRSHRIDERRVVFVGFSQGASLAFNTALTHPDACTGVIPVGGHYDHPVAPIPDQPQSVFPRFALLIGEQDEAVESNRDAARRLEAIHAPVLLRIYEGVGHSQPPKRDEEYLAALRFVLGEP